MSFRRFNQLFRRNELRNRITLRNTSRSQSSYEGARKKAGPSRPAKFILSAAVVGGAGFVGYETSEPFRHTCVASVRCYRVASECCCLTYATFAHCALNVMKERWSSVSSSRGSEGADFRELLSGVADYKLTFAQDYKSEEDRLKAYSECHTRSATRVLKSLLANGGQDNVLPCIMDPLHILK